MPYHAADIKDSSVKVVTLMEKRPGSNPLTGRNIDTALLATTSELHPRPTQTYNLVKTDKLHRLIHWKVELSHRLPFNSVSVHFRHVITMLLLTAAQFHTHLKHSLHVVSQCPWTFDVILLVHFRLVSTSTYKLLRPYLLCSAHRASI